MKCVRGYRSAIGAAIGSVLLALALGVLWTMASPADRHDSVLAAREGGTPGRSDAERCRRAAEMAERAIPLPYTPTSSTELVYLRVAGVRYAIPANYFRHPPVGCDTEEDGFLLRVLLPDFAPQSQEDLDEEREKLIRGESLLPRMWMNILLKKTPNPDLERTFDAYASGIDPAGDYPRWEGLLWVRQVLDKPFRQTNSIYFQREKDGKVSLLMVCRNRPERTFPTCSQFFRYKGTALKVLFGREHLADWKRIKEGTIHLLDGFVDGAR